MIKKERGITLVSLVIVIALMLIVSSTVVNISLDRFEINNLRKLFNDIELLQDKVSNYYLKYDVLPILRNNENIGITYPLEKLSFVKNTNDDEVYYILDLEAMSGIALNYGREGYENIKQNKNVNASEDVDVYIINQSSHSIYYVKGIKLDDIIHHTAKRDNELIIDTIPPTAPEINIISGIKNNEDIYTTAVEIEIIPGKDSLSGVKQTTITITKDGVQIEPEALKKNDLYIISENGTYNITVITEDNSGKTSTIQKNLVLEF